jgi:hypothetical protein
MRKMVFAGAALILVVALLAVAGCGSSSSQSGQTPQQAFAAFTAAAKAKDYQAVHDMLSDKYRKQLSINDIKGNLTVPPEITIIESKDNGKDGYVRYIIKGDNSGNVYKAVLLKENGAWKVDTLVTEMPQAPGTSAPGSAPSSATQSSATK